jgi:hypothetical protein
MSKSRTILGLGSEEREPEETSSGGSASETTSDVGLGRCYDDCNKLANDCLNGCAVQTVQPPGTSIIGGLFGNLSTGANCKVGCDSQKDQCIQSCNLEAR